MGVTGLGVYTRVFSPPQSRRSEVPRLSGGDPTPTRLVRYDPLISWSGLVSDPLGGELVVRESVSCGVCVSGWGPGLIRTHYTSLCTPLHVVL